MDVTSISSAKELVPLLIKKYSPNSIIDVGCGTGAFANEFKSSGIKNVTGYEGAWMRNEQTILPKENYVFTDLSLFVKIEEQYDLCLCLEVAEHLNEKSAKNLISILTSSSSRIAFSAAIPFQGGNHHINEQWPSYWSKLFGEFGFFLEWDPRLEIWDNSRIAPCYRQNLLIFSKMSNTDRISPPSIVHPDAWTAKIKYMRTPLWLKFFELLPSRVRSCLIRFSKNFLRN